VSFFKGGLHKSGLHKKGGFHRMRDGAETDNTHKPISSAYTFVNAEAEALVARMSTAPNATRKAVIDTLVGSLKTAGVWAELDIFYVLAAHTQQAALLNWVSSSYDATAVNSPAFVADRGFTSDASTSYLDTGFNITTGGIKLLQDDNHHSLWICTNLDDANVLDGCSMLAIRAKRSVNSCRGRNSSVTTDTIGTSTNSIGHTLFSRTASSGYTAYKDGVSIGTPARTSATLTSLEMFINAADTGSGVPGNFSTFQNGAMSAGGALTGTQAGDFYTALRTYMVAVGAPVP
jgi:hypothetical protein